MAKLIYSALCSLDGYVNDSTGGFGWCMPTAEVHAFVNDLERVLGTVLYGRRLYEVLCVWETMDAEPGVMDDYARIWRALDKVVFSSTLSEVSSARTRLVRAFSAAEVGALKDASSSDIGIGGPTLAAEAFRAGLVDEVHLLMSPVVVGGGTPVLPLGLRVELELLETRTFSNGVVHLHHRVHPLQPGPSAGSWRTGRPSSSSSGA
jgi:dihydrofolate reductase